MQEYAAQQEEFATLKERNRLARDIHDMLGHSLTGIIVQLEWILQMVGEDPIRLAAVVERTKESAIKAMNDVRQSVSVLRLPQVERPRGRVLWEQVARTFTECTHVLVTTEIAGDFGDLPDRYSEAVQRIIEEGLTNAVRHGHASRVDIAIRQYRDLLLVRISDNGHGVEKMEEGNGIRGIRERAEELGGSIAWVSRAGAGFDLGIDLPMPGPGGGAIEQIHDRVG